MKKAAQAAALILGLAHPAFADTGTTAANFLQMDLGARSVGMAGAFTAVADDDEALFHNPAGLALIDRAQLALDYVAAPQDVSYQHAVYAHPLGSAWTAALSINYMTTGSIDKMDAAGNNTGSYNGTGLAGEFALARALGSGLKLGAGVKVVRETLDDRQAQAAAFDAGVLYDYRSLRLGVALKDTGTKMKLDNDAFPLPQTLKFGASYRLTENFLLSAEGQKVYDEALSGAFGSELRLNCADDLDYIAFRLGYKAVTGGFEGSSITGGFGIKILHRYAVDLAFLPYGDMGSLATISLTAMFGHGRAPAAR